MHILVLIVGVIGIAAVWYWRISVLKGAAGEAADAAGRAKGWWNRRQFRLKSEGSALGAVDDPRTAATIMLVAVALTDRPVAAAQEAAIAAEMKTVMGLEETAEMLTFARWAAEQTVDPNTVSLKFQKLWREKLSLDERRDLLAMAERVAALDGAPGSHCKAVLAKLRERLGLDT